MLKPGQIINNQYEIKKTIGEGGSGQIFLAWHINLRKYIVVKRIKDHYIGKINERGEADILKRLRHAYLPQVYDYIQMEDEVYTVIDYIDGNSMQEYIDAGIRFDEPQIIKWMIQLSHALEYLHSQNPQIIHGDVKPANIMIDKNGNICLIDFNVSFDESDPKRITGFSPNYASPEQSSRAELFTTGQNYMDVKMDARSDIFSLAASVYHLMTLQNAIGQMKHNQPLWKAQIIIPYTENLRSIIEKALQRDPQNRYQSASELIRALETIKFRDRQYKNLKRRQIVFSLFTASTMVLSAFMTIRGIAVRNQELYYDEYQSVVSKEYGEDYKNAIDDAIKIINNEKYSRILSSPSIEKGNLLFFIANCYFENEDYKNAASFYEKAIEENDNNPEYYRDFAIAEARLGNLEKASEIIKEAENKKVKDADIYLVNGELASINGDYDNAVEAFLKAIKSAETNEQLGRAYLLCSRAYMEKGDTIQSLAILDKGETELEDIWRIRILREKGGVYIRLIEENGLENSAEWIAKADETYDFLRNSASASFQDWMNYEIIQEMKGDNANVVTLLQKMREKYPDKYQVPMRQALLELSIQGQNPEAQRDYHLADQFYQEAEILFKKYRNAGIGDDELQRLEGLMQDVHTLGWL